MAGIKGTSTDDTTETITTTSLDDSSGVGAIFSLEDGASDYGATDRKANSELSVVRHSGPHRDCRDVLVDDETPTTGLPDWVKKAMTHLDDARCTKADLARDGGTIELGEGYSANNELIDGQPNVPPRHISYDDCADGEFLIMKIPALALIVTVFFAWVQRLTR